MLIMIPILVLFIPGMAWGFSDPDVMLPEEDVYKVKKKEKSTLPEGLEEFMSENSNTEDNT